jgi:hypothetical protein
MQRAPNPRELREGEGADFRFRPPERWASAVGLVKNRRGETIQSGAATVDPLVTTVAAYPDATQDTFQLADVSGVTPGVVYALTDTQVGVSLVEVATVDPVTDLVTLVAPLPSVPTPGASFQGLEVTFAVLAITDRDLNFRAVVRGPGQSQEQTVTFDVVAQPWQDPLGPADVQAFIAARYPGELPDWKEKRCAKLAQRAVAEVRRQLRAAARYPDRFWDTSDLYACCLIAMRRELAREGLYPGTTDPTTYERSLKFDIKDAVDDMLGSSVPYDPDGDDKITDTEISRLYHGELRR